MSVFESVSMAMASLMANKMRALLTMLGIIIGIAAVIAISTVGQGLQNMMDESMSELGATNVYVELMPRPDDNGNYSYNYSYEESDLINEDMVLAYQERFDEELRSISMSESMGSGTVKEGRKEASVSVSGVNDGYVEAQNIDMVQGRFIQAKDDKGAKNVCVVSDKLVKDVYPYTDPLGQELKVYIGNDIYTFAIIGVYHYEDSSNAMTSMMMGQSPRTNLYIPVTTAKRLINSDQGYYYITAQGKPGVDSTEFAAQTNEFFNRYYEHNPNFMINAYSMESMVAELQSMQGTMILAISIIAGISLLVGGIGVMNIMLVSVTERTREIGTRKALGAPNGAIRAQFIIESAFICLIGGAIGTLLGIALGMGGTSLLGMHGSPTVSSIAMAVLFSIAIGVFFGYYPANKAAKLDPIEALRYE